MANTLQPFQFSKGGIQRFDALFAEVDGEAGALAFVFGIDDDAGAEFGVSHVLAESVTVEAPVFGSGVGRGGATDCKTVFQAACTDGALRGGG